jgi:hypothetical protein
MNSRPAWAKARLYPKGGRKLNTYKALSTLVHSKPLENVSGYHHYYYYDLIVLY